jgi:hypothetical protein
VQVGRLGALGSLGVLGALGLLGCGGATPHGAAHAGSENARPAETSHADPPHAETNEPSRTTLAAPPIEGASEGVRAAWALVAPMRARGHDALLGATRGQCASVLGAWHAETITRLGSVEQALEGDIARASMAERAPAHAIVAAAYTQAARDLEALVSLPACADAPDAALTPAQLAEWDTGDASVDRVQAEIGRASCRERVS